MIYFLELYTCSKNKIKVELDLSNYTAKSDLKSATGVDISKFVKKTDLASLKLEVDKLDIGKLEKVPSGLRNLKTKLDKLDVDMLQSVRNDLKK